MSQLHVRRSLLLLLALTIVACSRNASSTGGRAGTALPALDPDAEVSVIAEHIAAAQRERTTTPDLAANYPTLDRSAAYAVQLLTLSRAEVDGARVRGWKLGGTRITDPLAAPDPLFGYSLDAHVYEADKPLPANDFVGGAPEVEAEVALFIGHDLPGPTVSRQELLAALDGVGGAVEVLSKRLTPSPADDPASLTPEHAVADNLSHGGVILGDARVPAEAFDFDGETAHMFINGESAASGSSRDIMGSHGSPLDAVLWLANELPRHGRYLKAGDYVVTGSLYANPTVRPGDRAELRFSTLGTISFSVE